MPTNVTPEYAQAEREYQQAQITVDKLRCLEKMLSLAPSHKGGEHLRAEIKTKISKLKEKLFKEKEQKKKGHSLSIKKEGAAQIVLVGPPNTGKTSLLNYLANAKYETADYPFTTFTPNVGIMNYQTVRLQLVDLPPFNCDAALKQAPYFSLVRNSDLVLLVIDDLSQLGFLVKEFSESHILLNKPKPAIRIKRTFGGGLEFIGEKLIKSSLDDVKGFLRDHNLANAIIEVFAEVKLEDFFEVVNEKLAYLPALVVLTKQDKPTAVFSYHSFEVIPVSTFTKINLELLKEKVWLRLNLIRVYTKEPGRKPSLKEPITVKKGALIKDMASYIHKDFVRRFNYARVWGSSAKHQGQVIGLDHSLKDKDIVEIHLK